MEINGDASAGRAAGIILSTIGVVCLYMGIAVADGFGVVFLLLLGALLGVVAAAAFTAEHRVRIDRERGVVERVRSALLWSRKERFRLADFERVGIATGGRSSAGGGATTVYFVDLLGRRNLKLPGSSTCSVDIEERAREVAEYVGLPFDPKPSAAFFGKRL